ncbi:hypothetical protein NOLU111490_18215 [Novosphingobium lubricantis]
MFPLDPRAARGATVGKRLLDQLDDLRLGKQLAPARCTYLKPFQAEKMGR